MLNRFPEYTTDYIAGIMSFSKPQKEFLEILAKIVGSAAAIMCKSIECELLCVCGHL